VKWRHHLFAAEVSKADEVRLSSFQIAEFLCELGESRGRLAFISCWFASRLVSGDNVSRSARLDFIRS